jgi:hypothetical protein
VSLRRRGETTAARLALASAAALLALAAPPALAETWRGQELQRLLRQAPWHLGPVRVQPSLVIANAGVDSNIYYSVTEPIKDFTLTAGPAATVYIPFYRKFVLSLYGSPQYVWYSKTDRERTWNYYLRGAAQLSLKDVFFSIEGAYSDARERWNTEIDIRPRRTEESAAASILIRLAHRTSFALAARTVRYDYESVIYEGGFNVQESLNRREGYINAQVFYQASAQRRFSLDLEYGRYDFAYAGTAALKDSRSVAVYGGLEFSPLGRRVHGRIRIGYKIFDILSPDGVDHRGIVGDSQLSIRLARPLVLRGSYARDVRFSLWYDNPYFLESRPGVGVSLYPARFLRLDYDYGFGRNTYPNARDVEPGVEINRLDKYRIHTAAIYFRLMKSTGLGFLASFWTRDSNFAAEDDKRTFFGVNLTYEF